MITVQNMLSIYIILFILAIGIYMSILQSKYLDTVNHLDREAKFTKLVGYAYIAIAVVTFVVYLK